MKTISIFGALAVSSLLATAADAHLITVYPSRGPAPVAQTSPVQVSAAAPQLIAALPPAANPTAAAPAAVQPAPSSQPAQPVQLQAAAGQPITIVIEPAPAQQPAPQALASAAVQALALPAMVMPSAVPQPAAPAIVMPQTYQPFSPEIQRPVNCLIATGGNYVTCGINEALGHVYAEIAKCVNGVNVVNGCFAPKTVNKVSRSRRS